MSSWSYNILQLYIQHQPQPASGIGPNHLGLAGRQCPLIQALWNSLQFLVSEFFKLCFKRWVFSKRLQFFSVYRSNTVLQNANQKDSNGVFGCLWGFLSGVDVFFGIRTLEMFGVCPKDSTEEVSGPHCRDDSLDSRRKMPISVLALSHTVFLSGAEAQNWSTTRLAHWRQEALEEVPLLRTRTSNWNQNWNIFCSRKCNYWAKMDRNVEDLLCGTWVVDHKEQDPNWAPRQLHVQPLHILRHLLDTRFLYHTASGMQLKGTTSSNICSNSRSRRQIQGVSTCVTRSEDPARLESAISCNI